MHDADFLVQCAPKPTKRKDNILLHMKMIVQCLKDGHLRFALTSNKSKIPQTLNVTLKSCLDRDGNRPHREVAQRSRYLHALSVRHMLGRKLAEICSQIRRLLRPIKPSIESSIWLGHVAAVSGLRRQQPGLSRPALSCTGINTAAAFHGTTR